MKKPTIKQEVAIAWVNKNNRYVGIWATRDAIADFGSFGDITPVAENKWMLEVDGRIDLDEVVAYIKSYGKED